MLRHTEELKKNTGVSLVNKNCNGEIPKFVVYFIGLDDLIIVNNKIAAYELTTSKAMFFDKHSVNYIVMKEMVGNSMLITKTT